MPDLSVISVTSGGVTLMPGEVTLMSGEVTLMPDYHVIRIWIVKHPKILTKKDTLQLYIMYIEKKSKFQLYIVMHTKKRQKKAKKTIHHQNNWENDTNTLIPDPGFEREPV